MKHTVVNGPDFLLLSGQKDDPKRIIYYKKAQPDNKYGLLMQPCIHYWANLTAQ